ncbi:hypothetical protein OMP43_19675 [Sphingomonas sp. CBMAI 2297]|uniref:hypothetical protein n=1 Tax=Sphingomonas sp. CBMAI 2297 TaxID=2991720 RepID=UPI002453D976|nr:hypothetical protein [Sphingomonas sp. CBMAI 2297]MDH4746251.1 hypothetical protein [Sphingomonas sp. CBMAI 2297]
MLGTAFESDFEGLVESDFEFDTEDYGEDYGEAFDEAARPRFGARPGRGGRPGIKLPPRGNAVPRAVPGGFATKAELAATAKRLDDRIHTTSAALKAVDTRARAAEREIGSMGQALRKEIALRKKETAELKKGLDESRQIAMILPLIGGGNDKFSKMLPVLLYGGALGGSSTSASDGNNGVMTTMMMAIALSA